MAASKPRPAPAGMSRLLRDVHTMKKRVLLFAICAMISGFYDFTNKVQ
jgi:hypothetical protein